jgi:hypothetical protein
MTLEGVLGPNNRLDEAEGLKVETPEALCVAGDGRLLFSADKTVYSLRRWSEPPHPWRAFDTEVSALNSDPSGLVAIGLANARLVVCDNDGQTRIGWQAPAELRSVADCTFLSEDELVVVDHGYGADQNVLSVAPWDEKPRGSAFLIKRSGAPQTLTTGLHCPMGVTRDVRGDVIVTEFERARIVDASRKVRQSGYPAYLGRLRKTSAGYVMACISRRDPLIEFLKTERNFVAEMKASIAPQHWISPRLSPEFSHDFPIELGATRLFGEIKPWAPSFSYGLLVELDNNLMPVSSAHSRANGTRHSIADVTEWNGQIIAVSKGSGEILNLGARP